MASDEVGVMLRIDGAGAALPSPDGWEEAQASVASLPEVLAALSARRVVVVVSESAAPEALAASSLADSSPPASGLQITEFRPEAPAVAAEQEPSGGWQAGLAALGGTLDADAWPALPEGLARLAPVRNVLESAGQIGLVQDGSGTSWVACGFPDLRRPSSKVLLVREGDPQPEVIAMHRYPHRVGAVVFGDSPWLPAADLDPDPVAEARTGCALPEWGTLFAVEPARVFVVRDGRVRSWDGRNERDEGTRSQALASLVLRWSQR